MSPDDSHPPNGPGYSSEAHALAASNGDREAVESLLEQHLPRIHAYMRIHAQQDLQRRESISDLVQSVCREVLMNLPRFEYRGEPQFRAFLFKLAEQKLVERYRAMHRAKRDVRREAGPRSQDQTDPPFATSYSPSQALLRKEEITALEAAFDRLSEEDRRLVTDVRLLGRTHAEIAEELGISPATCRQRLHRAMVKLGSWMGEAEGDAEA